MLHIFLTSALYEYKGRMSTRYHRGDTEFDVAGYGYFTATQPAMSHMQTQSRPIVTRQDK